MAIPYIIFNDRIFLVCEPHFCSLKSVPQDSLVSIKYADNTQHLEIVKKGAFTAGTIVAEIVNNKEERASVVSHFVRKFNIIT